jgi:hypothetical protein
MPTPPLTPEQAQKLLDQGMSVEDIIASVQPVVPPEQESLLQQASRPVMSVVGPIFDYLNRPQSAVASAVLAKTRDEPVLPAILQALKGETHTTSSDVLGELGMDPGWKRTALGFGLDVASDPLNIVGGPIFRGVEKAASPLLKVGPVATALEELGQKFRVFHGATLDEPTLAALKAVKGAEAVADVGPETFRTMRRLEATKESARVGQAQKELLDLYKGVTPEARTAIWKGLETGQPLDAAGNALRTQQAERFSNLWQREVASGVQKPAAKVEDYTPYAFLWKGDPGAQAAERWVREVSPNLRFAKTRSLESVAQAQKLGAVPDILQAAAMREAAGEQALVRADFWKQTADKFGVKEGTQKVPEVGWRKATIGGDSPVANDIRQYYFPDKVANELEAMEKITAAGGVLDKAFRSGLGVWKGYATAVNPSFHIRNAVSNAYNMWLGGMRPYKIVPAHAEAALWMHGQTKAIGKFSAEAVDKAIKDYGITGLGHSAFGDIAGLVEDSGALGKKGLWDATKAANPLSKQNLLQRAGRKVGTEIESTSRVALFLDYLRKHPKDPDALENAAMHVKEFLFDYNELTDFERKLRDYGAPFYTWVRKDLELQLKQLALQPQKYAHTGKLKRSLEELAPNLVPERERPQYLQETQAVQTPWTTDTGNKVFANMDLPLTDLNMITSPIRQGLSMLNPLAKGVIELGTGRNLFTGGNVYQRSLMEPAAAPEWVTAAARHIPGADAVARLLGGGTKLLGNRPQYTLPALLAYASRQIPFVSKMGKVIEETRAMPQGRLGPLRPDQWNMLGGQLSTVSPQDRQRVIQQWVQRARAEISPTYPISRLP